MTTNPTLTQIARGIDPREWEEAETYRQRADEWFAKGRTEPGDALTDGYRAKADAMQAKLIAKAKEMIQALIANISEEMVEAGFRARENGMTMAQSSEVVIRAALESLLKGDEA